MSRMSHADVEAADLPQWRLLYHALQTRFLTGDYATGLRLVQEIGAAAEELDHHPDLDLRHGHLNVRLYSHDVMGVTERDVRLARRISELARAAGVQAAPERVSAVEVALDTPGTAMVRPFWAAVLGMAPAGEDEVRDDAADLPRLWFQPSEAQEPRQRFHLDVMVPPEEAARRIAAAVAAGGRVVSEEEAPSFTVLADAEGNKACVCTMLDRAEPEGSGPIP